MLWGQSMSTRDILKDVSKELLEKGKGVRLQVFGLSMFPAIRSGDFVWIEGLAPTPPSVGEVLYFQDPSGRLVIHRLIGINNRANPITFIAKGDGLGDRIDEIPLSAVLGRVTHVERNGVKKILDGKGPAWFQKLWRLLPLRMLAKHL